MIAACRFAASGCLSWCRWAIIRFAGFLYEEQDGHAKDAAEVKANEEKAREAIEAAREVSTAEALIEGDVAREAEEGGADER